MRVAICEDDTMQRKRLKDLVCSNKYFRHREIDTFKSGEELLKSYENGNRYAVLILDMELGEMNGIQTACEIRKYSTLCQIIIASGVIKYAVEGYSIQACDFILKPVNEEHFREVLKRAIKSYKESEQLRYQLKSRGIIKAIQCDAIIYFESNGRKSIIHCKNNQTMESNESISSVENQLKKCDFVRINRFYLVNLKYIKEINSNQVELFSGEKLAISALKSNDIKQKYLDYLVGASHDI